VKETHRLDTAAVDALAHGLGDASTIGQLRAGQVSKRLLVLRTLLDAARSARLDDHFALLVEVQRQAPEVVTALFAQPHTGAWLASSLRRLRGAWTGRHPIEVDLGHLGAIAASAAVTAGIEFKVDVPVRDGTVMLPLLGRATIGGDTTATVARSGGRLRVGAVGVPDHPDHDGPGWEGLRYLRSGELRVCLDDLDPFRDCHRLSAAQRLTAQAAVEWQRLLDEAWPTLVTHHPRYAEAIAAGLVTLVPLHSQRANLGVNVTSMDAFGAVSLTPPTDGLSLAVGLMPEFQHAKLGALIDLVPLYERDDRPRYYAPWRDDPRPLGALLQGVYAFQGVTDFWRVQRHVLAGGAARFAQVEFVRWRDRVWRTLDVLESSERFTGVGRRFLAGMRAVQKPWQGEKAPADTVELAREAAEDHWVAWRLRNRRPDPDAVARLAALWLAGGTPSGPVDTEVEAGDRALTYSARLDLVQLRILDPDRFAAMRDTASPGDFALACGDHATARRKYAAELAEDPDRLDGWIGLALACQRGDPSLMAFPELCLAVHRHLRATGAPAPNPITLASWLKPVTAHSR
jgi:HEXXH motif-containing protein